MVSPDFLPVPPGVADTTQTQFLQLDPTLPPVTVCTPNCVAMFFANQGNDLATGAYANLEVQDIVQGIDTAYSYFFPFGSFDTFGVHTTLPPISRFDNAGTLTVTLSPEPYSFSLVTCGLVFIIVRRRRGVCP